MKLFSVRAVLASVFLVTLAACAGKPETPVALRAGDPHSSNPNRIVCRQLPAPTGSLISTDKPVCHTYAEWQIIEKRSQEAISHGQHMPGSANSPN